jgi:beta-mannanase
VPVLRDRALFGVTISGSSGATSELARTEKLLGTPLDIVSMYANWNVDIAGTSQRAMSANGTRPVLVSWEPVGVSFADVYSGGQDSYLASVVKQLSTYRGTLYVRPWPEMNGSWSEWQPQAGGGGAGTPAEFVKAWRYLVTYFHSRKVTNLKFVFNPDASMDALSTPIASIWPGAGYIDVLGIDGFNWGEALSGRSPSDDGWREFTDIFAPMYATLTSLSPTAPVWIAETASTETAPGASRSKADWIRSALSIGGFPRVRAVIWFNFDKEQDWRLDSSSESLAAVRSQLASRRRG